MITDEATLEEIAENNSKLDLVNFFVVDQGMPRTELGVGVWEVESFVGNNTKVKLARGSQASNSRPSPSPQPEPQPVVITMPQPEPEPSPSPGSGTEEGRSLKRQSSSAFDDPAAPLTSENLQKKRATMQLNTLLTLKDQILKAKKAGIWSATSEWARNSVNFWVLQTVVALEEMVKNNSPGAASVVYKFMVFLSEEALSSRCYPDWKDFAGIMPRLEAAAGTGTDEAKLLERLAVLPQNEEVNTDGIFETLLNFLICLLPSPAPPPNELLEARQPPAPYAQPRLSIL